MSLSIFLVRHAQSANNAQDEHLRIPDPPITLLGHKQAQRLARALAPLGLTRLYTSPFLRSIETTRDAASTLGLQPFIHRDLFEQGGCYRGHAAGDRHPMPGMGRSTLQKLCPSWSIDPEIPDKGWNTLDHYEILAEARERAKRVATWIESTSTGFTRSDSSRSDSSRSVSGQTLASGERWGLIIHADFKLRLLEALLQQDDLERHLGEVVNTSISRLTRCNGTWKLDFWNSYQHLEPHEVTT